MKRVILRVSALGVVVILGLFAIAQAQRGADDSALASDQTAVADRASSDENAPRTILRPGKSASPLGTSAAAHADDNPLRDQTGKAVPTDEIPPAKMSLGGPLSGAVPGTATQPAPPSRRPADPFGLRANLQRTSAAEPGAGVVGSGYELADASAAQAEPLRRATEQDSTGLRPVPLQPPTTAEPYGGASRGTSAAAASQPYTALQPQSPDNQDAASPIGGGPLGARLGSPPPTTAVPDNFGPLAASNGTVGSSPRTEGSAQPGSKLLEGPQSPQLTVQKLAPEEIQVGKAATFRITVQNTGKVAADDVEIHDRVPKGTRLIDTTPQASQTAAGELVWTLGTIQPGDETSVEVQLMPTAEGEIGSVATVKFHAGASVRTKCTKPELVLETSAPERVLIGEEITLKITISNPGSGAATGLVLREHVPPGLQHAAGADLEYEIGDLPPGESCKLELTMVASRAGKITNVLSARGDGSLAAEDRLNMEVVAPQLDVAVAGPKRRYLEREATYRFSVHNPGTAPAEQIELVAYLPSGLKFVSANNAGFYEEADRTVRWQLAELPTNETGTVELVAMPVESGQQKIRLRGSADKVLAVEQEQPVLIEGIAAIMFEVVDVTDPIEVGGETSYEIRVLNQGSKAATNVRLAVVLPAKMRASAAEGPTRHVVEGNRVLFDGLARLAPKADTTYRVRAQALQPGDLRVSVQLLTDELQTPVTKEESTRVYSDE